MSIESHICAVPERGTISKAGTVVVFKSLLGIETKRNETKRLDNPQLPAINFILGPEVQLAVDVEQWVRG